MQLRFGKISGRNKKGSGGFSLIELAIIMTIVGLIAASTLETYRIYMKTKVLNDTSAHKNNVSLALARFLADNGRLPCPADPGLPVGDPMAGVEECMVTPPGFTCTGPKNALCRTPGARDTPADVNSAPDPVLIGAVPYVTLNIAMSESLDGWSNKFTYAVSEYLTSAATYGDSLGVINRKSWQQDIMTLLWSDQDAANGRLVIPMKWAFPIALVSHGPDAAGAYSYHGELIRPCATGTRDAENCDGDSDFTDEAYRVLVAGPEFYDDPFVLTDFSRDSDKWQFGAITGSMRNKQALGRVGIGTMAPTEELEVAGNIKLQDFWAVNYCNQAGANCFPADIIGGTGLGCSGGVLTGIQNANAACQPKISTASTPPANCPAGKYMTGFDAAGAIVCN